MKTMRIATALNSLRSLSHDELVDLIDLIDFWENVEGVHQRRKGKTPLEQIEYRANLDLRRAIRACGALRKKLRPVVRDQAATLRDALAPREYRKRTMDGFVLAQGTIQTKYIKRMSFHLDGTPWIDPDTGEQGFKIHGPYLYLRVWATGGGKDRREKRLKNKYIGHKKLAIAFEEGRVTAEAILIAFNRHTLDELEASLVDTS